MALEPRVGWIGIDARTVARIRKALEQREEGIVDELGVGALHLGYADRFFPGTSVLHTRARYALFVPWVFLTLAKRRVGRDRLAERKRLLERELTGALKTAMANATQSDTRGIIGVRVFPRAPAQPPDFAWWTALGVWGLYDGPSRGSLAARWDPERVVRAADEDTSAGDDVTDEPLARFNVPPVPGAWPEDVQKQGFDLTPTEAEWLRARWEQLPDASLLASVAALLRRGGRPQREGPLWRDGLVVEAAREADADARPKPFGFVRAIRNAEHASAAAELVRATYGAWVEEACIADAGGRIGDRLTQLDYAQKLDSYWAGKGAVRDAALALDLAALQRDLPELTSTRGNLPVLLDATLATWRRAKRGGDVLRDRALREVFEKAEWRRKGLRARLPKVEGRQRRAEFTATVVGVNGLDYRWSVTRRLVDDVAQGLRR